MKAAIVTPVEKTAIGLVFEAYAAALRALAACDEAGFTGTEVVQSLEAARDDAMHAYGVVTG